MAKQLIRVDYCDRCPVDRRRKAVVNRTFGFDDTKWRIALCEKHDDMLTRDIYAWGLLGESVEEEETSALRFNPNNGAEMRRLAELRTKQAQEDREVAVASRDFSVVASGKQVVAGLSAKTLLTPIPYDHKDWYFTQHALDRMDEREVDPIDILWACTNPTRTWDAREPGLKVHETDNGTHVVVNPSTKTIITVANRADADDRKAVM